MGHLRSASATQQALEQPGLHETLSQNTGKTGYGEVMERVGRFPDRPSIALALTSSTFSAIVQAYLPAYRLKSHSPKSSTLLLFPDSVPKYTHSRKPSRTPWVGGHPIHPFPGL